MRDTVAAIAQQSEYQRTVGQSVLSRIAGAIQRAWNWILDLLGDSKGGRTVTIVLLAILLVLVIARMVIVARSARDDIPSAADGRRARRARDAWADAQRLAALGSFTEAAHALLSALLASFAARGELRLHSSKTAGDYARELARAGSRSTRGFDVFRRRYDRVIYGDGTCSAGQFEELLADARPLLAEAEAA